jgi:hypothetical protein
VEAGCCQLTENSNYLKEDVGLKIIAAIMINEELRYLDR